MLCVWVQVPLPLFICLIYIIMFKPLEQFELFFVDTFVSSFLQIFITNYFITVFLVFLIFSFLISILNLRKKIVSTDIQFFFENLYIFILKMMNEQTGSIAQKFLPFVFSIFILIFLFNLFGLIPSTFTVTAQIFTTFVFGVAVLLGITFNGIYNKGVRFFEVFIPKGVPIFLMPLLFLIEVILYISRAFSLSIRLFANLMSGHILLNILSSFGVKLFYSTVIIGFFPFLIIFLVFFLEMGIAVLQAYVFCVLFCIYLNDCF